MVDAAQIVAAFRDVASTKSLSQDDVHDLLRDGIMAGLMKIYGPNVEAEIQINDESGEFDIVVLRRVVDEVEDTSCEISLQEAHWDDPSFEVGDVMEVPVTFEQFGRNAVQAVKHRIVQRVREGERQKIRDEYADRVGELLSGEVQQIERGKMVVMINRTRDADAIIPWKEQNPRERYRQGDPIRAVMKRVEETPKGPRLILSRADRGFVKSLFRLEVPEIEQGIVEIKEISREVGGRTKIAVYSRDEGIDPVGACVGLRGSRVQAVVSELGGERIDIVPWHPEIEVFARRSLAPARVTKVIVDPERQVITAIVDEDQLSLAIGRNGQNVRLASQLIGWQIDLYGSREWSDRNADMSLFTEDTASTMEVSDFHLTELALPESTLAALESAGYSSFLEIIDLQRADFLGIEGLAEADADKLIGLIDELTVVEDTVPSEAVAGDAVDAEAAEATEAEAVEDEAAAPGETADKDGADSALDGEEAPSEPVTEDGPEDEGETRDE